MEMTRSFALLLAAMSLGSAAAISSATDLDSAVAYVAKQANRTNTLHPSRVFYPDRVFTPPTTGGSGDTSLALWHGAHAPGSWTSGFWVGVNWFAPVQM